MDEGAHPKAASADGAARADWFAPVAAERLSATVAAALGPRPAGVQRVVAGGPDALREQWHPAGKKPPDAGARRRPDTTKRLLNKPIRYFTWRYGQIPAF
jgi:hypothetical protein